MRWRPVAVLLAGSLALVCLPGRSDGQSGSGSSLRIGVVRSLFRDTPEELIPPLLQPFQGLIQVQTGMPAQFAVGGEADALAAALAEDKLRLAVFHGFEFAWARQSCPELQPLVIAIGTDRVLHANLVVRAASKAVSPGDLKGQTLAAPRRCREHCRLYLERRCQGENSPFGKVIPVATCEEALDRVVKGTVQVALVDDAALEFYKRRKAASFSRLKTVCQSEPFPAGVVAYHPKHLPEAHRNRFQAGMLRAHQSEDAQLSLALTGISRFEPVPADYEKLLTTISQSYPAPAPPPPPSPPASR
jgi:ABC-type phosphate/phosphonate transport system substrate-binding protein